ncbi:hypothetical protein [Paraburkholderia sp. D1E]|uniref:hypothetical protein n=1 Tax=Paraburkholderia sp. D1E TaxID=3461398 RepID=UPI0040458D93
MQQEVHDAEEIEALCFRLFDGWCERRSVIPLAYLMHAWPIVTSDGFSNRRIQTTLRELQQFHPDSLTPAEHLDIKRVLTVGQRWTSGNPDGYQPGKRNLTRGLVLLSQSTQSIKSPATESTCHCAESTESNGAYILNPSCTEA